MGHKVRPRSPSAVPLRARRRRAALQPGGAACTVADVIDKLSIGKLANIAERSGRAQDKDDGGGLESLRREGYM